MWNPSDEQPEEKKKSSNTERRHTNNIPSNEEIEKIDHDYTDPYPSKDEWDGK